MFYSEGPFFQHYYIQSLQLGKQPQAPDDVLSPGADIAPVVMNYLRGVHILRVIDL